MIQVAVVGGINLDLFALVDRQPEDDRPSLIDAITEGSGGKGANQAVAAARLGAAVRLLGAVGDDEHGELALAALRQHGVDCSPVRIVAGVPTGRVVGTVTRAGGKRTSALAGANLALGADDVTAARDVIAESDVVICQLEVPPDAVRAALAGARAAGVPSLLDIAPAQGPLRELVGCARWVTGNRSEVEAATGTPVRDEPSARRAAALLRSLGPEVAGVTVGSAGQLLAWDGGTSWSAPLPTVDIVDTAGAGDAYAATLAVLLAGGMAPRDAAARASMASTLACRRLGAQAALPTRDEIEASL